MREADDEKNDKEMIELRHKLCRTRTMLQSRIESIDRAIESLHKLIWELNRIENDAHVGKTDAGCGTES